MKQLFFISFLICFIGKSFGQISDVPFMEFDYQNAGCNGFKYGTGSLIFVPNNAFCMEDGSACNGKVKIKYRELHTQTDMLVSGVNMLLKRDGKDLILESVGMFEIKAECDGKPAKLCDGKIIQVRMKCKRNLPNLEAYKYDDKQKRWIDDGQVYDFSYDKSKPYDEPNRWGNSPINAGDTVDVEGFDGNGEPSYQQVITTMMAELPDGFFKGMNIKSLGMYNYDGVIKDKDAVPMIPEFLVNTGEPIGETICVAYAKRNTLVTYYPDDFAERFVLLNMKGIKIFTKLKDGSYATLKEGGLDKSNIKLMQGTKQKFVLEKQPIKPKSKEELAKVTKISNT